MKAALRSLRTKPSLDRVPQMRVTVALLLPTRRDSCAKAMGCGDSAKVCKTSSPFASDLRKYRELSLPTAIFGPPIFYA